MIVDNKGYLKLENVLELKQFSIYETSKDTNVLVKDTREDTVTLYFPKKDRLPWKITEGKRICSGIKVFDSSVDCISRIDLSKWNNGNQIMCYEITNEYLK